MSTRRTFLRSALTGAAVLPFTGKSFASELFFRRHTPKRDHERMLDELERACFEFFWNEADPKTGLIRDRAAADGGDKRRMSSIAATGFGLTALCIGHYRGYRPLQEIADRVKTTLNFLANEAEDEHGFLYHFVDITDGKRAGHSELSPIDMAILLCGALTCRQYFHHKQIREDATSLYERVDWKWALNGGDTFALDWTPELGFSPLRWDSYCESMMLYLLAMGSPSHPIPVQCWHSFKRPWLTYDKYKFISGPAPLFIHQFSHAWFDFRNRQDEYTDYFANSIIACSAHKQFCHELSRQFPSYASGLWGITASDSSRGYVAWGGPPLLGPVDGSIVPAAAGGSVPFLYHDSLDVLHNLREQYGKQVWKRYGFVDAFNPITGWASPDVLGIDVGITLMMTENARSQFVWNAFMRNKEASVAMQRAGFRRAPANYNSELFA